MTHDLLPLRPPDTDHAIGDGICSCGCPAYRPAWALEYTAEMAQNDRQHDGAAEDLIRLHGLRQEVTEDGTTAHVWTLLPEPEELT